MALRDRGAPATAEQDVPASACKSRQVHRGLPGWNPQGDRTAIVQTVCLPCCMRLCELIGHAPLCQTSPARANPPASPCCLTSSVLAYPPAIPPPSPGSTFAPAPTLVSTPTLA